jgi:hypothetical protein
VQAALQLFQEVPFQEVPVQVEAFQEEGACQVEVYHVQYKEEEGKGELANRCQTPEEVAEAYQVAGFAGKNHGPEVATVVVVAVWVQGTVEAEDLCWFE